MTARPDHLTVRGAATGRPVGEIENLAPDAVAALVARARAAQPEWAALGFEGRARILQRAKAWMWDHRDRFIDALIRETGKPYEEAQAEVVYAASALDFWARKAPVFLADQHLSSRTPLLLAHKMRTTFAPRGVVGVIGPWNVPLMNSFGDCIPALAAGNAVVLKPSEVAPLSALRRRGDAEGGRHARRRVRRRHRRRCRGRGARRPRRLRALHRVDRDGRKVAHRAVDAMVPYTLELGGKDPMIVCADADLERAANAGGLLRLRERVPGRACRSSGVRRRQRARPVRRPGDPQGARAAAGAWRVPCWGGRCGASDLRAAAAKVMDHIDDAVERGATVRTGGHLRQDGGIYVEPTVLTGVDHSMRCMREETFGPTLPIMRVRD